MQSNLNTDMQYGNHICTNYETHINEEINVSCMHACNLSDMHAKYQLRSHKIFRGGVKGIGLDGAKNIF